MQSRYWLIVLVWLLICHKPTSAQQNLEPERGSLNDSKTERDYVRDLHETLLKDAATYYRARIVSLGPFRWSGWAITLVREGDVESSYILECAEFDHRQDGQALEKARVKRLRSPIDRETAEAVQDIWLRMLRDVRYPRSPRLGADGITYHFSRGVPLARPDPLAPFGWETGQIWEPLPSSSTGHLVAVAEALRRYAHAPVEGRAKVRGEILIEIEAVRSKLKAE